MESSALTEGARPQWYAHGYNRAELYRLAAAMGWLPRRLRLGLARRVGRLALSFLPAERAATRKTLEVMTGATGRRLDELTAEVFGEFAMCLQRPGLGEPRAGPHRLVRVGVITRRRASAGGSTARDLAHGPRRQLGPGRSRCSPSNSARTTHVVVAVEEAQALERWLRRDGDGVRFVPRSASTVSLGLVAALRRGEAVALQGDRALGNRGDVLVPFFGRPAPFPVGPFRLARASGAPDRPRLLHARRATAGTRVEAC